MKEVSKEQITKARMDMKDSRIENLETEIKSLLIALSNRDKKIKELENQIDELVNEEGELDK